MTDYVLDHLLRHDILHHADECMSKGIDGSLQVPLSLEFVPLVPHGRLITGTAVEVAEDPVRSEIELFVPPNSLLQDGACEGSNRDDPSGILILSFGDLAFSVYGSSDADA